MRPKTLIPLCGSTGGIFFFFVHLHQDFCKYKFYTSKTIKVCEHIISFLLTIVSWLSPALTSNVLVKRLTVKLFQSTFSGFFTQLHKLRSQLQGSFFISGNLASQSIVRTILKIAYATGNLELKSQLLFTPVIRSYKVKQTCLR